MPAAASVLPLLGVCSFSRGRGGRLDPAEPGGRGTRGVARGSRELSVHACPGGSQIRAVAPSAAGDRIRPRVQVARSGPQRPPLLPGLPAGAGKRGSRNLATSERSSLRD